MTLRTIAGERSPAKPVLKGADHRRRQLRQPLLAEIGQM